MSDTNNGDNFLPARTLHCTEDERSALIQTLALFESGKVKHFQELGSRAEINPFDAFNDMKSLVAFDFGHVRINRSCGTVGCILGWARYLTNDRFSEKIFPIGPRTGEQSALFGMTMRRDASIFPFDTESSKSWKLGINTALKGHDDVMPTHAAVALRTFLETGTPNWKEAFK